MTVLRTRSTRSACTLRTRHQVGVLPPGESGARDGLLQGRIGKAAKWPGCPSWNSWWLADRIGAAGLAPRSADRPLSSKLDGPPI